MKAGILYPRSKAHPGMMGDFMDGLKTALKHHQADQDVQLFSETIGFGGVEKEVYEKTEKLLVLDDVDMLVAFVDLRILEIMKPILYASGKWILIVNPGANYPDNWVPQPNVMHLTLQHAFSCWLTGKQAALNPGTRAAVATTFYDCGYLHTASMVKGFEKEGGKVTHHWVYNQRYDDSFDCKPLVDFLDASPDTKNLLCIFDSLPASLFYSRLEASGKAGELQLFVSPMMLDGIAREKLNEGCQFPVAGHLPWHASLENRSNIEFMELYRNQAKKTPGIFSVLGWDAGQIICEWMAGGDRIDPDDPDFAEKCAGRIINSPRGEMKLDPATHFFTAPVYRCSLSPQSKELALHVIENPATEWTAFTEISFSGVSSGWTNTYLCY